MQRNPRPTMLVMAAFAAVSLACSGATVGVKRISPREADRRLAANVLATGRPSVWSQQALHQLELRETYQQQPAAALRSLHQRLGEPELVNAQVRSRLFALSELSYEQGVRSEDREWFLASAVYAYCFILASAPDRESPGAVALDARTRLLADLYNRGITEAFRDGPTLRLDADDRPLPVGSLELSMDEESLRWGRFQLRDFVPAAEIEVTGVGNRYRVPGVGAPLSAAVEPGPDATPADLRHIAPGARVPTTLILRIEACGPALVEGTLSGHLELYAPGDSGFLEVFPGQPVPLETEWTASVAQGVEASDLWESVRRSFLSGDLESRRGDRSPLVMLFPYRPGKIPVVFVHGTNSDPTTWAEMANEIMNDPVLGSRVQPWFFFYQSSDPVSYSGGLLADSLRSVAVDLDPHGTDDALRQMVLIGHSQGGLLVKLALVQSHLAFWNQLLTKTPDEFEVSDETRAILRRSLIFEPVPEVTRAIFISTPHGGSFLARNPLAGVASDSIAVPGSLVSRVGELMRSDPNAAVIRSLDEIPTSIDDMTPGNRFLETLRSLPIARGVEVHSIVAIQGDEPKETGNDGVVEYLSAHLEVGTERLVRSGHSAQRDPEAIDEVRSILREHVSQREGDLPEPSDLPGRDLPGRALPGPSD